MATRKSRKTPTETAPKTATRVPKHGNGALLVGGQPGNKGGGRPPEAFKAMLARLRESPALAQSLEQAIQDHTGRGFASALKVLTDYDDDKPAEKKELSGKLEVRVKITREGRRVTAS